MKRIYWLKFEEDRFVGNDGTVVVLFKLRSAHPPRFTKSLDLTSVLCLTILKYVESPST